MLITFYLYSATIFLVISPLIVIKTTQFLVHCGELGKECSTLEFANIPNVEDAKIGIVFSACCKLQYCQSLSQTRHQWYN